MLFQAKGTVKLYTVNENMDPEIVCVRAHVCPSERAKCEMRCYSEEMLVT